MALTKEYPEDFERLWKAYPKWPVGRSKKEPSYKAFAKAKKDLVFDKSDIDAIEADIEQRKRYCESWQKGSPFGPEMFSTYFNQHRWNEPYKKTGPVQLATSQPTYSEEDNKRAWVRDLQKRGVPVPPEFQRYVEVH